MLIEVASEMLNLFVAKRRLCLVKLPVASNYIVRCMQQHQEGGEEARSARGPVCLKRRFIDYILSQNKLPTSSICNLQLVVLKSKNIVTVGKTTYSKEYC